MASIISQIENGTFEAIYWQMFYPDKTFAALQQHEPTANNCRTFWINRAATATGRKAEMYRNRAKFYPVCLPRRRTA
jgi:hypothetical protein